MRRRRGRRPLEERRPDTERADGDATDRRPEDARALLHGGDIAVSRAPEGGAERPDDPRLTAQVMELEKLEIEDEETLRVQDPLGRLSQYLYDAIGRYHPFDGDGMVHMIRFHAGTAEYRNRFVRTRGFEGRLVVLAEPEIAPGDCKIEWADGGVVLERAAIEVKISELVGRYLASRDQAGNPAARIEP